MTHFVDIGIDQGFEPYFKEMQIKVPSLVQRKAIPCMLDGQSLVVISQTGTGKTLSYCLPLVQIVKNIEKNKGRAKKVSEPVALVMAPTRELVVQVGDVLKKLSHHMKLRVRVLVGGLGKERSMDIKGGAFDVLVATPRKILKSVQEGEISLAALKFAIFDEADNLFEMGYAEDVVGLEKKFQDKKVQVGFYTATLPPGAERLITTVFQSYEPEVIKLPGAHSLVKNIEVINLPMEERQRYSGLSALIDKKPKGRGIVFVTKKTECQIVFDKVSADYPRLKKTMLHGDMEADERRSSYRAMKDHKAQVLFATDIAARGMDLEQISWVINYDLPKTTDYYLHRCGRTGRMGRDGFIFNFVSPKDKPIIQKINRSIAENGVLKIDSHSLKRLKPKTKPKPVTEEEKIYQAKLKQTSSRRGKGRYVSRLESESLKKSKPKDFKKNGSPQEKKRSAS